MEHKFIDSKDETIISILEKNGRTPFTQIAEILEVSEAAVRKRIKKLEEKEIILGYKAHVNYKKLGYANKVVMGVDTTSKDYFNVLKLLGEFPEIRNLSTSSGDHMIMFEVWIRNMSDLSELLERVNKINGVTESCPSILHEAMN
ncbi:MAG: Lrp/AsnC family transcriptional regulator [Nanoarchaeota archaeon]|nr:Lrp/AsnC family transcriptional regulator [Nanoarchaeota archaeon]